MNEDIETTATDAEDHPLNAVIIVRKETDAGVETEVFLNGDVKATEVQTIIELGLGSWRTKLGL